MRKLLLSGIALATAGVVSVGGLQAVNAQSSTVVAKPAAQAQISTQMAATAIVKGYTRRHNQWVTLRHSADNYKNAVFKIDYQVYFVHNNPKQHRFVLSWIDSQGKKRVDSNRAKKPFGHPGIVAIPSTGTFNISTVDGPVAMDTNVKYEHKIMYRGTKIGEYKLITPPYGKISLLTAHQAFMIQGEKLPRKLAVGEVAQALPAPGKG